MKVKTVKNKLAMLLSLLFVFLLMGQGASAAGESSKVTIGHVDQATLSAQMKQKILKGNVQVVGDGENYQYMLVYEKKELAVSTSPIPTESGIPSTGDEGIGLMLQGGMMVAAAALLILLTAKKKKWAKGILVLMLLLSLGAVMQQTAMAEGSFPKDIAVEVAPGEKYVYTPPVIDSYSYVGYIAEKTAAETPVPIKGKVLVCYADEEGNELAERDTLTGAVGEPYQSREKTIYGWGVVGTDGAGLSGNFKQEELTVKYIYQRKLGTVFVRRIDEQGNELKAPYPFVGHVGTPYVTLDLGVDNYKLKEIIGAVAGIFTEEDIIVEYVYEELPKGTVIAYYVNDENEPIVGSFTSQDYVGKAYETEKLEFENHTLNEMPANASGTYIEGTIEVTYQYERAMGEVCVHYLNTWGDEIAEMVFINDRVGKTYQAEEKDIYGYALVEIEGDVNGKIGAEEKIVNFIYVRLMGELTVRHIDLDGVDIVNPTVTIDYVGISYGTIPLLGDPPGWEFVRTEGDPVMGELKVEPQFVTYVYQRIQSTVTVRHIDGDGNVIAPPETKTGVYGGAYETQAAQIENYRVKEIIGQAGGTYGEQSITVEYIYEELPMGTVTIYYVDVDGEKLREPIILQDYVGKKYTSEALTFDNYVLKSVPINANGEFEEGSFDVTYVYEKYLGKVTVYHQDIWGNQLAEPDIIEGPCGTEYITIRKAIDNYELTETSGDLSGYIEEVDKVVRYIYAEAEPPSPGGGTGEN